MRSQSLTYSKWQRFIDECNRNFDAFFDKNSYIPKKYPPKPGMRSTNSLTLLFIFILRALITPVISTVYVFSRLGLIVLNPQAYRHNPAKASLMLGATLLFTGLATGLAIATSFFSAQTMISIAGSVGGGAAVVGLLGMFAFATLLHGAKAAAQQINKQKLEYTEIFDTCAYQPETIYVTAPKHHLKILSPSESVIKDDFNPVKHQHKCLLVSYYQNIKLTALYGETSVVATAKDLLHDYEQGAQKLSPENEATLNASSTAYTECRKNMY